MIKVPFIELGIAGEEGKNFFHKYLMQPITPVESGKEKQCPSVALGGGEAA